MGGRHWFWELIGVISLSVLLPVVSSPAQAAKPALSRANAAPAQANPKDVAGLQDQLLGLLRLSPTLAEVVARDPSLLGNQEYVQRNNPELAAFLRDHSEIAQNPDFYLFNNLHGEGEQPSETLERKLWP